MYLIIGLLIIVIIVLIVTRPNPPYDIKSKTWDCIDRQSGDMKTIHVKSIDPYKEPEKHAIAENTEYFTGVEDVSDIQCNACTDNNFAYAINEFGAPGLEFKDWVTSQSVEPQVLINHANFIKSNKDNTSQVKTGRTYSPDSHDSYDPLPWQGLRRPRAVPVASPTQVPDVDYSLYETKSTIKWG